MCCDGKAAEEKEGDWGKFCPGAADCAADGERNQGAAGFPNVDYKPCCSGQAAAAKEGDWGKFCGPVTTTPTKPGNGCRRRRRRRL